MDVQSVVNIICYGFYMLVNCEYIIKGDLLVSRYKNYKQGIFVFLLGIIAILFNMAFIKVNLYIIIGCLINLIYWFIADIFVSRTEWANR